MHFLVLSLHSSNKVKFLRDLVKLYTITDILHKIKQLEIKSSFSGFHVSLRHLLMTGKGE